MKTVSKFPLRLCQGACALLAMAALTGCEMPPRDAWRIIQRDGLLTYWDREYNPQIAPSRYLYPTGRPLIRGGGTVAPYQPAYSENRYLASGSGVPYRRPAPRVSEWQTSESRVIEPKATVTQAPEPKQRIPLEPSRKTNPVAVTPPAAAKPAMDNLPFGTPVPGRPGMVNSPFATKQQLVDVTGMAAGEAVKDPYSGKLFRVPPAQEAAAKKTEPEPAGAPATEAPEAPETSPEEAKPQP
ncbi:hypothetical protein WJU23_06285 [Prosthecobacter sp. SYSU 5D2]|uniref:hypothetical protein n=1 Tax=Prosthecobacter sp. SYSU 5D2 TaxID=3134134 RepID=UPI0031FF2E6F